MENILEIKKLNLFFDKYQALYNVDLTLKKGVMEALVGESGCGKSMTAMSIMRLLPKTAQIKSGEIYFKGENLLLYKEKQMRELRGNRIALIPQDPMTSLNPLYTVGNQLVEAIRAHSHVSERQALRKAREVMDMVCIPDADRKLKFYPHEFSGGMKQRIIIAMALACQAELIIADEPTTALDVTIQAQVLELLHDLKHKINASIMLITHDLGVVASMCDYVVVMYAGRVIEKGTVHEIFKDPKHPYTVGLIKSLPSLNAGNEKLYSIPGNVPNPINMPNHCYFKNRCDKCFDTCFGDYPSIKKITETHEVSCHLYE